MISRDIRSQFSTSLPRFSCLSLGLCPVHHANWPKIFDVFTQFLGSKSARNRGKQTREHKPSICWRTKVVGNFSVVAGLSLCAEVNHDNTLREHKGEFVWEPLGGALILKTAKRSANFRFMSNQIHPSTDFNWLIDWLDFFSSSRGFPKNVGKIYSPGYWIFRFTATTLRRPIYDRSRLFTLASARLKIHRRPAAAAFDPSSPVAHFSLYKKRAVRLGCRHRQSPPWQQHTFRGGLREYLQV